MPGGLEKACHRCISTIASNACFVFVYFAFLVLPLSMTFTVLVCTRFIICLSFAALALTPTQVSLLLYNSTMVRRLLSKAVVIDDNDNKYPWRQNVHEYYLHLLLSLFLFLWVILGNYWVFLVFPPDFIAPFQQPQNYCDSP